MQTLLAIADPINKTETTVSIKPDGLVIVLIFLLMLFIGLLIFTIMLNSAYRQSKQQIAELEKENNNNKITNSLSKEENTIINLYNQLDDKNKQSIENILKTMNSKQIES